MQMLQIPDAVWDAARKHVVAKVDGSQLRHVPDASWDAPRKRMVFDKDRGAGAHIALVKRLVAAPFCNGGIQRAVGNADHGQGGPQQQ